MERAALPVYLVAGCDFVVLASAAVYADPRRRRCLVGFYDLECASLALVW